MSKVFIKSLSICSLLILVVVQGAAQKPNAEKFAHAVERSRDAARVLPLLTAIPDEAIPRELIDSSSAIGVFPKVERETLYFTHMIHGYGVISVRRNDDWTMPAFYQFMGAGYGNPFSEKENYGVVLLFFGQDTIDSFEKGGVRLNKERQTVAGPVGASCSFVSGLFMRSIVCAMPVYPPGPRPACVTAAMSENLCHPNAAS